MVVGFSLPYLCLRREKAVLQVIVVVKGLLGDPAVPAVVLGDALQQRLSERPLFIA